MKTQSPIGSFLSTPIHAPTAAAAREIIGRTYTAERWTIKRHGQRHDYGKGKTMFGGRYSFMFLISPKPLIA